MPPGCFHCLVLIDADDYVQSAFYQAAAILAETFRDSAKYKINLS